MDARKVESPDEVIAAAEEFAAERIRALRQHGVNLADLEPLVSTMVRIAFLKGAELMMNNDIARFEELLDD